MAKKVLLIVFGAVAALVGAGLGIVGVVLLALTGGDGFLGSGEETLRTATPALVSDVATLEEGDGTGGLDATARIEATSLGQDEVFLGVGPAADVDRYLGGVQRDEVVDVRFSPFRYETVQRPGLPVAPAPADQPFWTARATGSGPQALEFRLDQSAYRVVVMNADGSPGVVVRATFGVRAPFLRGLGTGLTVSGVLLLLLGLALLVWGIRTRVPPPAPAGWGYPPGYGAPGYGPPGYGAPGYGAPGYGPPGYGPPGYGPPGYGAPGYGPPGYGAPGYGTPGSPGGDPPAHHGSGPRGDPAGPPGPGSAPAVPVPADEPGVAGASDAAAPGPRPGPADTTGAPDRPEDPTAPAPPPADPTAPAPPADPTGDGRTWDGPARDPDRR